MAFKISLVSDVRGWLKGTRQIEDSLDDIADDLDDLGRESADEARTLERKFSDAFREIADRARTTGRGIGDDIHDGTRHAKAGMDELSDEANQTAREAAASFDGSAESILDAFQEVAANAFAGFGPAGQIAGLAAAAGIGILYTSLQDAADKAADTKTEVIELSEALADVKGDSAALDWATRLREALSKIVDEKQWFEVWQDTPKTRLESWSRYAQEFGINMGDVARAVTGDTQAMADVQTILASKYYELSQAYQDGDTTVATTMGTLQTFRQELADQAGTVTDATQLYNDMQTALSGLDDTAAETAEATATYQTSVVEALDEAGRAWEKYTEDGKTNLDAYNDHIEAQAKAILAFEGNLVTASSELSAEALNYVKSLGPEAAPLLKAFLDAPVAEKKRTAANWDALGRATTDGYSEGLALDKATADALGKAQTTAANTPIEFETKLDASRLQSDVDTAASRIRPPTIKVRLAVDKERP